MMCVNYFRDNGYFDYIVVNNLYYVDFCCCFEVWIWIRNKYVFSEGEFFFCCNGLKYGVIICVISISQ